MRTASPKCFCISLQRRERDFPCMRNFDSLCRARRSRTFSGLLVMILEFTRISSRTLRSAWFGERLCTIRRCRTDQFSPEWRSGFRTPYTRILTGRHIPAGYCGHCHSMQRHGSSKSVDHADSSCRGRLLELQVSSARSLLSRNDGLPNVEPLSRSLLHFAAKMPILRKRRASDAGNS